MSKEKHLTKIVHGARIIFISILISKIITFFYRLYIARFFGPEIYGLFSIGVGVISIVATICLVGMDVGVSRYISFYNAKNNNGIIKGIITSALKIVFPLSILFSSIIFIYSGKLATIFDKPELTIVFRILALAIPFYSLNYIFLSVFKGFKKSRYYSYSLNIIPTAIKLITVVLFGIMGLKLLGVALSWAIAYILTFFVSLYLVEKKVFPIFRSPIKSVSLKKELIIYSLPMLFAGVMWVIMSWTDTIILGYFKTSEVVGIYNAAIPIATLLLIIPFAFSPIFMPIITELYSKKKFKEMENTYKRVTKWILYLNFPIFLLFIIFSKQLLNIMFGHEYIVGFLALSILSLGFLALSLFRTSMEILTAIKKTKYIMYSTLIANIFNILLNIYLIPIYGIIGAAIATTISLTVYGVMLGFWVKYFTKMFPLSKDLWKSVFSGALSIIPIHFIATYYILKISIIHLVLLSILYFSLYGLLLIIFKGFDREDRLIFRIFETKVIN